MAKEEDPRPPPFAAAIRAISSAEITRLGGNCPTSLPYIEYFEPRREAQAVARMRAMCGLREITFGQSIPDLNRWMSQNRLTAILSENEARILAAATLSRSDEVNLSWYIEAIGAFAWAGTLIPTLPIEVPIGNQLAALFEGLHNSGKGLEQVFRLRPQREIYAMLDLYYVAHWYARDGQLNGYATDPFEVGTIMERRKALEWLNDESLADWDDISLDT